MIIVTNYVVTIIKNQKLCDEYGNPIENIYAYLSSAIRFNLKKITTEFSWSDEHIF